MHTRMSNELRRSVIDSRKSIVGKLVVIEEPKILAKSPSEKSLSESDDN